MFIALVAVLLMIGCSEAARRNQGMYQHLCQLQKNCNNCNHIFTTLRLQAEGRAVRIFIFIFFLSKCYLFGYEVLILQRAPHKK